MDWLKNFSKGITNALRAIPEKISIVVAGICALSIAAYIAAIFGGLAYDDISSRMPVTQNDIDIAKNKAEIRKINNESVNFSNQYHGDLTKLEKARTEIAEARAKAGLTPERKDDGISGLVWLLETLASNLSAILAVMVAAYLLPTFSTTGESWRLVLNISAAVVLSGVYALVKGVTSDTSIQLKWTDMLLTVNSNSVGLILILLGSVLAGLSLYMLHKPNQSNPAENSEN